MKKIILSVAVVATAAISGINYFHSQQDVKLSDLALDNVEALARYEGDGMTDCPNGCLTTSGDCFCYGYHPYHEASW